MTATAPRPARRWQRRTIALAHDRCQVVTTEADVLGDIWAYCKTPWQVRSMFVWGWQVTHVPTGRVLVGDLTTKAVARRIVRRIADVDWERPEDRRRAVDVVTAEKLRHADREAARWAETQLVSAGIPHEVEST